MKEFLNKNGFQSCIISIQDISIFRNSQKHRCYYKGVCEVFFSFTSVRWDVPNLLQSLTWLSKASSLDSWWGTLSTIPLTSCWTAVADRSYEQEMSRNERLILSKVLRLLRLIPTLFTKRFFKGQNVQLNLGLHPWVLSTLMGENTPVSFMHKAQHIECLSVRNYRRKEGREGGKTGPPGIIKKMQTNNTRMNCKSEAQFPSCFTIIPENVKRGPPFHR